MLLFFNHKVVKLYFCDVPSFPREILHEDEAPLVRMPDKGLEKINKTVKLIHTHTQSKTNVLI